MTKTFTPTLFKNLSNPATLEQAENNPDQKLYEAIKPKLDELYREPSEETIAKILKYAKKR